MSEATDRVRDVAELPIFPLSLVLFPGAPVPLHIFEPRYRQMLDDIQATNNFFGISYFDSSTSELAPAPGHVGCVAELTESLALPDGRSNILAIGVVRYRVDEYIERGDPYLVARVSYFEDEEDHSEALYETSRAVAEGFTRIAKAVRTINDDQATLPDMTDTEPQRLSFLVAAAMEVEADVKQELLELRVTSQRLERLRGMLDNALASYEERARIHQVAKGNGHGGKRINFEQ